MDTASVLIVCRPVIQVADKAPLTLWRRGSGSVVNPGEPGASGLLRAEGARAETSRPGHGSELA